MRRMALYHFTPTDRVASNLEEFLSICQQEPVVAEDHLRAGWFAPWLYDAGYGQLAATVGQSPSPTLATFLATATPTSPVPRRRARARSVRR
jgi:hypothetical protein